VSLRGLSIGWLYAFAAGHLLMGLWLAWWVDAPLLAAYHDQVVSRFGAPQEMPLVALHQWWLRLFGATLFTLGVFFLALVRWGHTSGDRRPWRWLAIGLLLWAPQDMAISWAVGLGLHLVIDAWALALSLPPLIYLGWFCPEPAAAQPRRHLG
jgi:hypothetical protein